MLTVWLNRGYGYFDELTNTHLTTANPRRIFTDEEIARYNMSAIYRSIKFGTLKAKEDIDSLDIKKEESGMEADTKDPEVTPTEEITPENNTQETESKEETEVTNKEEFEKIEEEKTETLEETNEENPEEVEDNGLKAFTEDGEPRCQEIKNDGEQCTYAAKYPEDNPKYCGRHKNKLNEE